MTQAADLLTTSRAPAAPRLESASNPSRPRADEPSLGELKARHREDHLCLRCNHHMVCGMAKSLDPNLLVTIASCLGFESDQLDDLSGCAR
jgi:hypothetical protein